MKFTVSECREMSEFIQFFWGSLSGRKGVGLRLLAYLLWCLLWAVVLAWGAISFHQIKLLI